MEDDIKEGASKVSKSKIANIIGIIIVLGIVAVAVIFIANKSNAKKKTENLDIEKIVDIKELMFVSPDEAIELLGRQEIMRKTTEQTIYIFQAGKFEVVFENDSATMVRIHDLNEYKFDSSLLEFLGLPATKPTISSDNVLGWQNVEGIKAITAFPPAFGAYIVVKFKE